MTELDLIRAAEQRLKTVEKEIEEFEKKAHQLRDFVRAMSGKTSGKAPRAAREPKAATNGATRKHGAVPAAILGMGDTEFCVGDVCDEHPALNKSSIQQTVHKLFKKGKLEQVKRGFYRVNVEMPVSEKSEPVEEAVEG
jgi:hypothetical protein